VGDADAVALDPVDPAGGRVEEHVHEVVRKQVDLVHVEDAPVGAGEQAGVELGLAVERVGDREGADHALAGRPEREGHEGDRPGLDRRVGPRSTLLALVLGVLGRTPEGTVGNRALVGQEVHRGPDRTRFGGPLLAADQQAVEVVVRGDREQRPLQALLPDDRRKGDGRSFFRAT